MLIMLAQLKDTKLERDNPDATKGSSTMSETTLAAINNTKSEFSTIFDLMLAGIENVRKDITDCSEWAKQA